MDANDLAALGWPAIIGFIIVAVVFCFLLYCLTSRKRKKDNSRKIYIICPVRKLTDSEKKIVLAYVEKLEKEGYTVRCPFRDTNQIDEIGLRIVAEHEKNDIIWADEIHIWWNPTSEGSLWDFAQARMASYFQEKKIVLINVDEIEITRDEEGKIKKTYTNVLLATHFGLRAGSSGKDLEKAKNKGA